VPAVEQGGGRRTAEAVGRARDKYLTVVHPFRLSPHRRTRGALPA
jgi:hypothetical protein